MAVNTPTRQERIDRKARSDDRSKNRRRVRSPYSAMQFYDDAGTALTPQQYEMWKEGEAQFGERKGEVLKGLDEYKGNIGKQSAAISKWFEETGGSSDAWFEKVWNKFKTSDPNMVTTRLVGADGKVLGTYTMHNNILDPKFKELEGKAKGLQAHHMDLDTSGLVYIADDGTRVITVGKSYKDSEGRDKVASIMNRPDNFLAYLEAGQTGTRDAYEKQVRPELEKKFKEQLPMINKSKSALKDAQLDYELKKKSVDAQIEQKTLSDAQMKQAYKDRLKTMESLFGGMKVERKGTADA